MDVNFVRTIKIVLVAYKFASTRLGAICVSHAPLAGTLSGRSRLLSGQEVGVPEKAVCDARTISQQLSEFAATLSWNSIPEITTRRAKHLILDAVGLAFASVDCDFARASRSAVSSIAGAGDSIVLGSEQRLPPRDAALINGLLIHGLDYDDTHLAGIIHATASVFPAALAAGLHNRSSGRELLTAYVIGMECAARIAAAAGGDLHHVGFHPTGVVGGFGCALTAGRLFGLTAPQLTMAQGIALSFASGCIEFVADGAWTKRLHPGHAAACGIAAAALAKADFSGPTRAYEGRYGFYNCYLGEQSKHVDLEMATSGIGTSWEVLSVAVKPYPACHFVHSAVDAMLLLKKQHGFSADDVRRVVVALPEEVIPVVCQPEAAKKRPANGYDAKFSIPYVVARALVDDGLGIRDFDDDRIGDPSVLRAADRVDYRADALSGFPTHYSAELTVSLADGRTLVHREAINRGCADRPLTEEEIVAKFMDNITSRVSKGRADKIREMILSIEELADARELETILAE